jgi:hypothetical protein
MAFDAVEAEPIYEKHLALPRCGVAKNDAARALSRSDPEPPL